MGGFIYMGDTLAKFLVKGFIKGIIKFILIIVLAVVLGLGSMVILVFTSNWLSGYREYILYIIPISSMSIAMGVIFFWFFIFFYRTTYKRKLKNLNTKKRLYNLSDEIIDVEIKNTGLIYKLLKFYDEFQFKKQIIMILIMLSAVGLFYSYTTYNVITENQIIVHNPVNLSGKIYSYSDVREINTGISDDKDTNLYYRLRLNDNTNIDVTSASIDSKEENCELAIYYIDQKLIKNGVNKNIDTKNISKFENKRYDKNYVENVKKILR